MLNLKEQSKIANKKAPLAGEALSITNKIFNIGKITTKNFLSQEKTRKKIRLRKYRGLPML